MANQINYKTKLFCGGTLIIQGTYPRKLNQVIIINCIKVFIAILKVARFETARPTQRAANGGYAPRFLGIVLTLSVSRLPVLFSPAASNAHRWAAYRIDKATCMG